MKEIQIIQKDWQMLPLCNFASSSRAEVNCPPLPVANVVKRTKESERARLNAYRKTAKGAEYVKNRSRINSDMSSIARKCIREGRPVPPEFPTWCHELKSPDVVAKVNEHGKRKREVVRAAIKHYRDAGFFAEDTPAYALKVASEYIDARKRGAEVRAGVAIASWLTKQTMGRAIKARKAARNRIKIYAGRMGKRIRRNASGALGCSKAFFKSYIEAMFEPWMTWENYGTEWHIDHVVPLSFAGDDVEGIELLGNYRNTRPLSAAENMRKSDSMPEAMTDWQAEAVRTITARKAGSEPA